MAVEAARVLLVHNVHWPVVTGVLLHWTMIGQNNQRGLDYCRRLRALKLRRRPSAYFGQLRRVHRSVRTLCRNNQKRAKDQGLSQCSHNLALN
jgi:hypothetical protein